MRSSNPGGPRGVERRSERRYPCCVPCTLSSGRRCIGLYWTENVSLGGALLVGGHVFELGSTLELTIHVPTFPSVQVRATVTRHAGSRAAPACGVFFDIRDWLTRSTLQRALEGLELLPAHTDPALIVTRSAALEISLAQVIAALGIAPICARTPVEALWWLTGGRVGTVLLGYDLANGACDAWLDLLDTSFPHVTRAVIADGALPFSLNEHLHQNRLDGVLVVPWNHSYLKAVLTCRRRLERPVDPHPHRAGAPSVVVKR